ncbi:hypothetical protein EDD85DRAFT_734396, partial [Armillaria nabsnona]
FPSLMTAMSKLACLEYAPTKSVIVGPSPASPLLIHCALDDKPDRLEVADHAFMIQAHLDHLRDKGVK